ncbi:MAG: hypothetical protein KGO53_11210 [Alphaproteobacteria bacterium]|nr:hypothetical protein [Alphaproteobacteria bacterium]
MSTLPSSSLAPLPVVRLASDIQSGSAVLWRSLLAMLLGLIICGALMLVDARQFNGVDVWDKPAKFFLALIVQMATVSWALAQLPPGERATPGISRAVWAMTAAAWAELLYICFRAARAEASHFNASSIFAQAAYGIMGLGAVTLTLSALFIGIRLWQRRGRGLMTEAAGVGLIIGMVLGTLAGAYVSAQTSHWVGGEMSDAHGLGFFSWSGTGGDLRVAHFIGLHAAQAVPFAALSGSRPVVYLVALACIALTAFTFAEAVMGIPLFRI